MKIIVLLLILSNTLCAQFILPEVEEIKKTNLTEPVIMENINKYNYCQYLVNDFFIAFTKKNAEQIEIRILIKRHVNSKLPSSSEVETLQYSYPCFIAVPDADRIEEVASSKLIDLLEYLGNGKVSYTINSKGACIAKSKMPFVSYQYVDIDKVDKDWAVKLILKFINLVSKEKQKIIIEGHN